MSRVSVRMLKMFGAIRSVEQGFINILSGRLEHEHQHGLNAEKEARVVTSVIETVAAEKLTTINWRQMIGELNQSEVEELEILVAAGDGITALLAQAGGIGATAVAIHRFRTLFLKKLAEHLAPKKAT